MRRRARRAFTLIESIAAIAVLAAIGSVASTILLSAVDGYAGAALQAQLHTEGSIGLDRIVRELQSITLDTGAGDVAPDIESVDSDEIVFDDDSSFALVGTNLKLADDGAPTAILLSDVSAFTLAVYDESNASLSLPRSGASCDAIRRIQVTLTITRDGTSETLSTKVFLRCTMSGAES